MTEEIPVPDDGKLYRVLSPSKIWLSPEARELCALHGMTETEMARHLLDRHKLAQAGLIQRDEKEFM